MRRIRLRAAVLLLAVLVMALSAGRAEEGKTQAMFRSAGQIVTLGRYEQDGNAANGPEPIEWIILEMKEGRCLLLSRYALDVKPYHTESVDITWENCFLRGWLNDGFLNSAFNDDERSAILLWDVDNGPDNCFEGYGTTGGNPTADKIFLLSWAEADQYFSGNMAKICAATTYAYSKGAWTSRSYTAAEGKPACSWWLRSPGFEQREAIRVGNIAHRRDDVAAVTNCVRPALWLNLNADVI